MLSKLNGNKTYILAVLGIVVAVAGHFWGPFQIGDLQVPQFTWNQIVSIAWGSGLFAALRHGVSTQAQ